MSVTSVRQVYTDGSVGNNVRRLQGAGAGAAAVPTSSPSTTKAPSKLPVKLSGLQIAYTVQAPQSQQQTMARLTDARCVSGPPGSGRQWRAVRSHPGTHAHTHTPTHILYAYTHVNAHTSTHTRQRTHTHTSAP